MTRIRIEAQVDILAVDDCPRVPGVFKSLTIKSSNTHGCIVLCVDGHEYEVFARDIRDAVERCTV